ncbi:MAG: hypothetical protein ACRDOK_26680 [Streptosporangiaceae bacterium]
MATYVSKRHAWLVAVTRTEPSPSIAIITAVDRLWQTIRARHPDVPAVVIALAAGPEKGNRREAGHFQPRRWQCGDAAGDQDARRRVSGTASLSEGFGQAIPIDTSGFVFTCSPPTA